MFSWFWLEVELLAVAAALAWVERVARRKRVMKRRCHGFGCMVV